MTSLASVRSVVVGLAILGPVGGSACVSPSPHAAPLVYDGVPTVPKRFDGVNCMQASAREKNDASPAVSYPSGTLDVTADGIRYEPIGGARIEIPWSRVKGVMWKRFGTTPDRDRAAIVQEENGLSTMTAFGTQPAWIFRTIKYAAEVLGGVEPMPRGIGFASSWVECHGSSVLYETQRKGSPTSIVTSFESKAPDPIYLTVRLDPPGGAAGEVRLLTLGPRKKESVSHTVQRVDAEGQYVLTADVYTDPDRRVLVDRNRQNVKFAELPEELRKVLESGKQPSPP